MFPEKEAKTIGQYFNMKTIFSFVLGIIVGVLFAVPLVERGKFGTDFFASVFDAEEENILPLNEKKSRILVERGGSTAVVSGDNSLVVEDQRPGFSVIMSMVSLSESGWVAVHEETNEGTMGNILGARRFAEGKYFGSTVELLRATESGSAYYVVLHSDDGDSIFDFTIEAPARDHSGALIVERFFVTSLE
ncbi:MAG: hypothetical protein HYT93_03725 [Parcubacteria group bacterium]|nr:hypothetical protein [Parcubacteria group bacterium]